MESSSADRRRGDRPSGQPIVSTAKKDTVDEYGSDEDGELQLGFLRGDRTRQAAESISYDIKNFVNAFCLRYETSSPLLQKQSLACKQQ